MLLPALSRWLTDFGGGVGGGGGGGGGSGKQNVVLLVIVLFLLVSYYLPLGLVTTSTDPYHHHLYAAPAPLPLREYAEVRHLENFVNVTKTSISNRNYKVILMRMVKELLWYDFNVLCLSTDSLKPNTIMIDTAQMHS